MTSRPPRHRLDYVDQIVGDNSAGDAPSDALYEFGTDPSRLRDVDVLHLTDITKAIGTHRTRDHERTRRAKRLVKLLKRRRIALVRSIDRGEPGSPPSRADRILDRAATHLVSLTDTTSSIGTVPSVIAHSHLRDRFLGFPRTDAVPGRLMFAAHDSLSPSYEPVLKVFAASDLPGWTLHIAGRVPSELAESYARTIAEHPESISQRDEVLSDAALVEEVSAAEILFVAAPTTYESQSLIMLALSLDRPVLVEESAAMRSLADEVGPEWVRMHAGALSGESLEAALVELRYSPVSGRPDLDARDPNTISGRYASVYLAAATER